MPLSHSASSVLVTFKACDRQSPGVWVRLFAGRGSFFVLLLPFDLSTCLLLSFMRPECTSL